MGFSFLILYVRVAEPSAGPIILRVVVATKEMSFWPKPKQAAIDPSGIGSLAKRKRLPERALFKDVSTSTRQPALQRTQEHCSKNTHVQDGSWFPRSEGSEKLVFHCPPGSFRAFDSKDSTRLSSRMQLIPTQYDIEIVHRWILRRSSPDLKFGRVSFDEFSSKA